MLLTKNAHLTWDLIQFLTHSYYILHIPLILFCYRIMIKYHISLCTGNKFMLLLQNIRNCLFLFNCFVIIWDDIEWEHSWGRYSFPCFHLGNLFEIKDFGIVGKHKSYYSESLQISFFVFVYYDFTILFILKLPINFFSVNGHECYKIINLVSSFLLKLKFILSLVSEVSKIYYLETFLSKKCKSIEFVPISAFPSFPEIGLTGTSVKI